MIERSAGIAVSVVALAGCVWWALRQDPPKFPSDAGGWSLVVFAVLLYAAATIARGWRWHAILRHAGIQHRLVDALGVTTFGYMGNTVLPARGGEVLRIIVMRDRSSGRRREILGSIIPERTLDVAALAILFCTLTLASDDAPTGPGAGIVAAGMVLLGGVALFVYHRMRVAGHFDAFAARVRPVARASRLLITPWGLGLWLLTCAVWLTEGAIFVVVARSIDVHLTLIEGFLSVVLASFFALIPAAPGYVGTYDAAVLFALKAAGVTGSAALSVTLLFRFVVFVPVTIVGLVLLLTRYGGLATLRSAERTADERFVGDDPAVDIGQDLARATNGTPVAVSKER